MIGIAGTGGEGSLELTILWEIPVNREIYRDFSQFWSLNLCLQPANHHNPGRFSHYAWKSNREFF